MLFHRLFSMDELHVHSTARVHKFSKNLEAISKTLDSEERHKGSSEPEI
jgi:hypothetical protein